MNSLEVPLWRQILKTNFVNWEKLADFLELTLEQRQSIEKRPKFVLSLPRRLASKIKKRNIEDPILKQFLPTRLESQENVNFYEDPVGDLFCQRTPKLLHKYEGRVLLVCTSACAMHCRYCFRQNYPYQISGFGYERELEEIAGDRSILEVILSGGDPLSLSNENLEHLLKRLNAMPHIKRIRFHSRFPIGIPERIDAGLLGLLEALDKQIWFVIHSNHPNEFDEDIWQALAKLRKLGISVINQSVLLRGVNDNVQTLKELCLQLVDHGIQPYYLHQLDRVVGAMHFEVEESKGRWLIDEIRKELPGYAVPLYVREIPGQSSKTPL